MTRFRPCPACEADDWAVAYEGDVRRGRFPNMMPGTVMRCAICGLEGLDAPPIDYTLPDYRALVDADSSPEHFFATHDAEIAQRLSFVAVATLRGKTVADVGCGGGSFLDAVRGLAQRTIAIEPATQYHASLSERGHEFFPFATDAFPTIGDRVDLATSFAVIEHIEDPYAFVKDIAKLLRPGGKLVLSTPNAREWLLEFLPGVFDRFFYRFVHRWYFDARSLEMLLRRAGFAEVSVAFHQTYDLSNALNWARDGRPTGLARFPMLQGVDAAYRQELERLGRADTLVATASLPEG